MGGTRRAGLSLLAGLILVAGCGDGKPKRYAVSGTVLFQGRPLDEGSIQFVPKLPELSPTGAPVARGAYAVPKSHGLAPGVYEVRVSSGERGTDIRKEMDPDEAGGEPYPIAKERIPARYNKKSELSVEVKDGGPFTFDFDLKGK